MIECILLFRDIALNKKTQAVYYDLVYYADYDAANIERLKRTSFRYAKRIAATYGGRISDKRLVAMILTSDAFAKAMFKGIMNGILDFSFEEAVDYFFRRVILPDVPVPDKRSIAASYGRPSRPAKGFRVFSGLPQPEDA